MYCFDVFKAVIIDQKSSKFTKKEAIMIVFQLSHQIYQKTFIFWIETCLTKSFLLLVAQHIFFQCFQSYLVFMLFL